MMRAAAQFAAALSFPAAPTALDHLVILPGELAQELRLSDVIGVVEIEEEGVLGNRYRAVAERDLSRQDLCLALSQHRRDALLPLVERGQQRLEGQDPLAVAEDRFRAR